MLFSMFDVIWIDAITLSIKQTQNLICLRVFKKKSLYKFFSFRSAAASDEMIIITCFAHQQRFLLFQMRRGFYFVNLFRKELNLKCWVIPNEATTRAIEGIISQWNEQFKWFDFKNEKKNGNTGGTCQEYSFNRLHVTHTLHADQLKVIINKRIIHHFIKWNF